MASWNDAVIETFRANHGVVGGPWEGKTLILLHSIGRRSGNEYVNPLVAAPDGEAYVVCGTFGGAPTDPNWVGSLEAARGPATVELARTRSRPTTRWCGRARPNGTACTGSGGST